MATQQLVEGNVLGFVAENDLSDKVYHYVELSATAGQVDVCDNAADVPVGVLQNNPAASEVAAVAALAGSVAKVVSDGSVTAITVGSRVGTDASGRAVVKSVAGAWYNGIALEASSVAGKVIPVLLTGPQQVV